MHISNKYCYLSEGMPQAMQATGNTLTNGRMYIHSAKAVPAKSLQHTCCSGDVADTLLVRELRTCLHALHLHPEVFFQRLRGQQLGGTDSKALSCDCFMQL